MDLNVKMKDVVDAMRDNNPVTLTHMLYNQEGLELFSQVTPQYTGINMTDVATNFVKGNKTFTGDVNLTAEEQQHLATNIINVPTLMKRKVYKKTATHLRDLLNLAHSWKDGVGSRKKLVYFQIFSHAYYYIVKEQFVGQLHDTFGHPMAYINEVMSKRTLSKTELEDFTMLKLTTKTYTKYGDVGIKHESIDSQFKQLSNEEYQHLLTESTTLTNKEWFIVFVSEMYRLYAKDVSPSMYNYYIY